LPIGSVQIVVFIVRRASSSAELRQLEIGNRKSAMPCGSDVAGNMRVFQTRFESSNLSFRSNIARVAKWLRRRIADPVFVSSSLTARSNLNQPQMNADKRG
jgi:hypothetical protein